MRGQRQTILMAAWLLGSGWAGAATITAGTEQAWDSAVSQARAEVERAACSPDRFLATDRDEGLRQKVRGGRAIAAHTAHGGMTAVPEGLIHHWRGSVFLSKARNFDTLGVLQSYDSYAQTYDPAVVESKLLSREQDTFKYRLKFRQEGFGVKVGLLGEFRSKYVRLANGAGYSVTEATRLVELKEAGTAEERELTTEESRGYVEKVFTIARYREAGDGVYLEVETLTLSRDVPAPVRWVIAPVIQKFSRQVMIGTLEKFRDRLATVRGATEEAENKTVQQQARLLRNGLR